MIEQTSKISNYLDHWITPVYFVFFIGVWAYLRHYLNLTILASLLPNGEFATVGPYELNWVAEQYKCWISQTITFVLLASLQAVNLFWFVLIIRILVRFLVTSEAKDERSDDETETELEPVDNSHGDATHPKVTLNGGPIEASSTGMDDTAAAAAGLRKR